MYASGYRPEKSLAYYRTLQALPLILGEKWRDDADYLDGCRQKRNTVEYDYVGGATADDVRELIECVRESREQTVSWLREKHPGLLPPDL
ncbi:MAG: hypothetical protein LBK99_11100 [Opitutaceae bacterium]|nr:hypothetical protein [Opitutaceae bacterium]